MTTPNPGSPAAVLRGCTCSTERNLAGDGEPINEGKNHRWYIAANCPMHSDFYQPET